MTTITLRNLNAHTRSEIVAFVKEKLLAQGRKSVDQSSECLYRAPDGCKCAIGHLMADDDYNPDFEHTYSENVLFSCGISVTPDKLDLLGALQAIHDLHAVTWWADSFKQLELLAAQDYRVDTRLSFLMRMYRPAAG